MNVKSKPLNMSEPDYQRTFWEAQDNRRSPDDPVVEAFARPKLEFVRKYADLAGAPSILDVGCGNGYFTYYLERIGPTIGVDYSGAMLQMNPCSRLVQASAHQLPFGDQTFDVAFCSNLLHHVEAPIDVVAEMKRVSRKYVVLHEPNRNNPLLLALGLFKKEERKSLRFTRTFLRRLGEQAGLEVLACETMGFVTPNRMPRFVVKLLQNMNRPNPLGAFGVLVSQRK